MSLTSVAAGELPAVLSVHGGEARTPRAEVRRLAALLDAHPELARDQTSATRVLEDEVARGLGKEGALLMPTGKLAQQIALRVHADARPGRRAFAGHPAAHMTVWEEQNYSTVHGLTFRPAGERYRLMTESDLTAVVDHTVATVLWELPQRDLRGQLPAWDDLSAQLRSARSAGAATHLDGAGLWQVGPHYGRELAEVCADFDSVYVSTYKDLGAPRGALLAGSAAFLGTARRWRQRLGGTMDEAWPLALLALDGLRRHVPRMHTFTEHARSLATAITERTDATVVPDPPQSAMFHLHLPVAPDAARAAVEEVARTGLRLGLAVRPGPDPHRCSIEITVGEAASAVSPSAAADAVTRCIDAARAIA